MIDASANGHDPTPEASGRPAPFELTEEQVRPDVTELLIGGEVDIAVIDQLSSAVDQATGRGDHLLIDLSRCKFIDSSGLALFVRANRDLTSAGRRIFLHGCRGQVERVLEMTGLEEAGLVMRDRDAALLALRPSA